MPSLPPALETLIHELMRLPSIGRRGAERLALHLLEHPADQSRALAESLTRLHAEVRPCAECGNWSAASSHPPPPEISDLSEMSNPSDKSASMPTLCPICADPRRDATILCVVEKPADLWALEEARFFNGKYHVLGGALSPLGGVTAEDLTINSLERRLAAGTVHEIILATNPSVDGDATAHYLAQRLTRLPLSPGAAPLQITRIAQGVPLGGALGYADAGTLKLALETRRAFGS